MIIMFVTGSLRNFTKKMRVYKPGHVVKVFSWDKILSGGRHATLMKRIQEISGIDQGDFNQLYQPVLNKFVEFVQVLPSHESGILSGMLNEGFARAILALRFYTEEHVTDNIDPLVNYAIFTAGLFREIAKVLINQVVVICNEEGAYIDDWQPLKGSLVEQEAEYYKIYPMAPTYMRIDNYVTAMLARQLMPSEGFDWIASDMAVFADWLDALNGDAAFGGVISRAIVLMRREDIYNLYEALPQVDVDLFQSLDNEHGEAFLEWLREGIENGDIKVNDNESGVHTVADGLFLEKNKIFHQFTNLYNAPVNMMVVFEQFGNLFGITKKGGNDFISAQYFSEDSSKQSIGTKGYKGTLTQGDNHSVKSGMLVSNAGVAFKESVPVATSELRSMKQKVANTHQSSSVLSTNSKMVPKSKPS